MIQENMSDVGRHAIRHNARARARHHKIRKFMCFVQKTAVRRVGRPLNLAQTTEHAKFTGVAKNVTMSSCNYSFINIFCFVFLNILNIFDFCIWKYEQT